MRAALAATGLLVGLALLAQIPAALGLMDPDPLFEAWRARDVLIVNAVAAALVALGAAVLPWRVRALAMAPGAALALATLTASVTVGSHLWDLGMAMLTAAGAWWLGRAVLRLLHVPALTGLVVAEITVGFGVLGLGVLALGRAGAVAWWSAGAVTIALGLLGATTAARAAWPRRTAAWQRVTETRIGVCCAGLLLLQLGWAVVWLSAPEIMFDALYGKAYLPALWAETGSIGPLTTHPVLNVAGLTQIVATPGHAVDAVDVGRQLQLLAWGLLTATVWQLGDRRSPVGPLAALAVGTAPHVVWQATTAYDDLMLAVGALALGLAVMRTAGEPGDREDGAGERGFATALAIGLLAGACIWLKLNLVALVVVLAGGWVLLGGRHGLLRRAGGVLLGGTAIAAPAFALRWIDTGNPVFPSYNTIFKSPHYPEVDERFNFPFWPDASFVDLVRVPYEAIFHPTLMDETAPAGAFGLLVAIAVAALLVSWRTRDRRVLLVWAALAVSILFWWLQFRYLRYLLPTALLAVMLVVLLLRDWRPGRGATVVLLAAAAAVSALYMPSTVASFWNVPHRDLPLGAAFGRWDEQAYLRTVFSQKDALDAYQRAARPGANAISDASERLLLDRRDLSPVWEVKRALELSGPAPESGSEALRRLRGLGIEWALLTGYNRISGTDGWLQELLRDHGELVFADRSWDLYRLVDRPPRLRSAPCDDGLRGQPGCWTGTLDAVPGLVDGESAGGVTRTVAACPGQSVAVRLTLPPVGELAQVQLDAQGGDGISGHTTGAAAPGTTERVGLTVPPGATAVTVRIVPGADGGAISRATVGVLGTCADG